jgi:hypothetical protein
MSKTLLKWIRFNYVIGTQLYDVFVDKKNDALLEGVLLNDILGARIEFKTHSNNKLLGYMNVSDIKIGEIAHDFLSKEMIDKLSFPDFYLCICFSD